MKLITVGTVAFDTIATPFEKREKVIGGAATYIALAASYLNGSCGVVSVVGDDFPKEFMDLMVSRGIDLQGLQVKEGEKSFHWAGEYHLDMNSRDTLATDLNVLATFEPHVPEGFRDADYVMLGNLVPAIHLSVLNQMSRRPKLVVLDTMNFWMDTAREDLDKVFTMVDVVTINDEEARQYTGERSLKKAAQKILALGPKALIIKKGEHGALLFSGNEVFYAPAMLLEEVKDPTGAGDSFAGGFIGYLAKTDDISFDNMKKAIVYGSAMASFTCEDFGPDQLLKVNEAELAARLNVFSEMVRV